MEYRIYDKEEKQYIEEPDYNWLISRTGKLYSTENDKWFNIGERYEVEFFTGLFDKTNKKIFENDIVHFYTFSTRNSGGITCVVEYQDGRLLPFYDDEYIQDEQGDWFEGESNDIFQVINNIHKS